MRTGATKNTDGIENMLKNYQNVITATRLDTSRKNVTKKPDQNVAIVMAIRNMMENSTVWFYLIRMLYQAYMICFSLTQELHKGFQVKS